VKPFFAFSASFGKNMVLNIFNEPIEKYGIIKLDIISRTQNYRWTSLALTTFSDVTTY
jgi:hypothetical protein